MTYSKDDSFNLESADPGDFLTNKDGTFKVSFLNFDKEAGILILNVTLGQQSDILKVQLQQFISQINVKATKDAKLGFSFDT